MRIAAMKRDDLLLKLENRGVPSGPINNVKQALTDPQIAARGMVMELDEDGLKGLRTPIRFSDSQLSLGRARHPCQGTTTERRGEKD